jgi:ribosomal 50S subunit-recycling heat shock protein
MRVSIVRSCVCWAISAILPLFSMGQALPEKPGGAILHTQGGVWVNGYEAHDSSAVFPGDVIETKPDSSANLSLDGSTVLIAPESVSKFQEDLLELDHGGVSVVTSKSFKVRVNCILVVPVMNDWTQYEVTDLNGTVQVAARKLDVNVEHERGPRKEVPESQPSQESASVHEGEQKSYDESKVCGPGARPTSSWGGISPKWIAAGAAGAGILIWLLIHGGNPKTPASPSQP